jgi:hypothetical protein
MTMLGAQLDDLQSLSAQLHVMSGDVTTTRDGSVATTSQVIGEVAQATATALQQITTQMEQLQTSVQGSVARAEATQWTGANADRFRQGASDFQSSLAAGQAATRDAFTSFQSSAAMMSDTLQEFVTGFSAALTDASASASDMATAVEAQRANLDSVMNLGLSIN